MGEVVKYACLRPALLPLAARGAPDAALVAACARVKLEVVERDPTEKGERKLLNLGHTFGHGVEAAGRFSAFTHGESVAIGLAYAFRLARRLGRVDDAAVAAVDALLDAAGLPRAVTPAVARRALALMAFDKKRGERGLLWVLPRGAGRDWTVEWDVEAGADAVAAAAEEIAAPGSGSRPVSRRGARSSGAPGRTAGAGTSGRSGGSGSSGTSGRSGGAGSSGTSGRSRGAGSSGRSGRARR
jgi:3-dehydroquinate synthetase